MKCEVCNANVNELRRGRCWGCYNRWVDARPVGVGARCCVCSERRRDALRSVELLGGWLPMCYTCSGRAMRLDPLPQSLAEIRKELDRERRRDERRIGKPDTRVFQYDRRTGDRRGERGAGDDWMIIDEEMIVEMSFEEPRAGEPADADMTAIRELPAPGDREAVAKG
jgi:hypothetical protein